jgi:hypothetical protein
MLTGLTPCLALLLGCLHANSESVTRIDIGLAGVRMTTHLQALSLLEVLPSLDSNADGVVSQKEMTAHAQEIRNYVALHQSLGAPGGASLPLSILQVNWLEHDELEATALGIEIVRVAAWDDIPSELVYGMDFFFDTSPMHTERLLVFWHDGLPTAGLLDSQAPTHLLTRPASLRRICAIEGLRTGGLGALALLLTGLLMGSASRRRDGLLFAGFAVAGAWLSTSGWSIVEPRVLSLAMAMAATYLALDRFFATEERGRSVEAVLFGAMGGVTAEAYFSQAVPGAFGLAPTLIFACAAMVPGYLIAALLQSIDPKGRALVFGLALISGSLFLARTVGWLPHGL